jgi:hypothetical protein
MGIDIPILEITKAYRKSKADTFFEHGHNTALDFADFEENLVENLLDVRKTFQNWRDLDLDGFVGSHTLVIKGCEAESEESRRKSVVFFSDARRSWEHVSKLSINFRVIGQHPVIFHILSSLWIEKVGRFLDHTLGDCAYGCRLKKLGAHPRTDDEHTSIGHFRPYFRDYQRWQQDGIEKIREAIVMGKKVIAVTADITKFYHRIDIRFLRSKQFLKIYGMEWSSEQIEINEMLVEAITRWSDNLVESRSVPSEFTNNDIAGIPIGLGASKIIANIFLKYLDDQIQENVSPIFYGRYVDDIFLVLEDHGKITTASDFWSFFSSRIKNIDVNNENGPVLHVPYGSKSKIEFGRGKEKLFILENSSGISFIEALRESLEENSSEWKMLPDTKEDLDALAKQVAEPAHAINDAANGLRKTDGMSIERLKFVLHLRNFEALVELLPKSLWVDGLSSFINIAHDYVLSPGKVGTFTKYLPRILRMVIRAGEPLLAVKIIDKIRHVGEIMLERVDPYERRFLKISQKFKHKLILESLFTGLSPAKYLQYNSKEWVILFQKLDVDFDESQKLVEKLFVADLHFEAFKSVLSNDLLLSTFWSTEDHYLKNGLSRIEWHHLGGPGKWKRRQLFSEKFLSTEPTLGVIPKSLYFFTRPATSLEISTIFPQWCQNERTLKAFRNFQIIFGLPKIQVQITTKQSGKNDEDLPVNPFSIVEFEDQAAKANPVLALTSFLTKNESWVSVVREDGWEPDEERYARLFRLINDILRLKKPKIDYLVFPELSLPRKIVRFIAAKLRSKNISLVTGVEYEIATNSRMQTQASTSFVSNQLVYVLTINRPQGIDQVMVVQEKNIPAIHEERELFDVGGKILRARRDAKYLIRHRGFFFSGLICNDILNIDNRFALRGMIDFLFVIEWNKDVNTYDSIVSSTCNDLHCFVVQVNNRKYGDTRVRAPYKESYLRDSVRVQGGSLIISW